MPDTLDVPATISTINTRMGGLREIFQTPGNTSKHLRDFGAIVLVRALEPVRPWSRTRGVVSPPGTKEMGTAGLQWSA